MDKDVEFILDIKKFVESLSINTDKVSDIVIDINKEKTMTVHIMDAGTYKYFKYENFKIGSLIVLLKKYDFSLHGVTLINIQWHLGEFPTVAMTRQIMPKLSKGKDNA